MTAKDLILLMADLDAELTMKGLLLRHRALGIRPVGYDIIRHAMRDSGCRRDAATQLRGYHGRYAHALVIFDRHGCGADTTERDVIEREVEEQLARSGWPEGHSACIVLDPELESWVWSDSPEVARVLGWREGMAALIRELREREFVNEGEWKPRDPKAAMKHILRRARIPHSAALFARLAAGVGLSRCHDPAFHKFVHALRRWFPDNGGGEGLPS